MSRRLQIDIVTHYWPPIGGPGSKRMQTWARGFVAAGHAVRVWAPPGKPGDAFYDAELQEPDGVTSIRIPFLDLSRPFRRSSAADRGGDSRALESRSNNPRLNALKLALGRFVRDQLTLPDYRRLWNPRVAAAITRVQPAPDVIITTSPYESTHLVGRAVQKLTGALWIADFRDLWGETTLGKYRRTALHDLYNRHLELDVLKRADIITVYHDVGAAHLRARGGDAIAKKTWTIHNGVDRAVIAAFAAASPIDPASPWRIVHAGTLWDFRWPPEFLRGWGELRQTLPTAELHLIGRIEPAVLAQIEAYQRTHRDSGIRVYGAIPGRDVAAHLQSAHALLILASAAADTVTSKIFEAIAAQKPILYFGHPQSGGAELLRRLGAVKAPSTGFDAAASLAHWRAFAAAVAAGDTRAYLPRLDRDIIENERQVARLLDLIEAAIATAPRRGSARQTTPQTTPQS